MPEPQPGKEWRFEDLAPEAARLADTRTPRAEAVEYITAILGLIEERTGTKAWLGTAERIVTHAYHEPPPAKPARCYVCDRTITTYYTRTGDHFYKLHGTVSGDTAVQCLASAQEVCDGILIKVKDHAGIARLFVQGQHLRHQDGSFYRWHQPANAWIVVEDKVIRAELWRFLEKGRAYTEKSQGKGKPKQKKLESVHPTQRFVSEITDAVQAAVNLPKTEQAPRWLDDRDETTKLLAFPNALLDLSNRRIIKPTPAFYNHIALPFNYDPNVREAPQWQAFLESLWPTDPESISTLQEMFGYLVSGETRYQKIFMLVGPKRGGKGTIARVLRELIGHANFCAPTLAGLGQNFGSEMLIHKLVAVVSDARITGKVDSAVVAERLLRTSGEDADSIQRKFRDAWQGQLLVRFVLLTNILPRIEDASSALASRFVILRLTRSFLGSEDLGLFARLLPELPGILNWALEGWDRLQARGHFTMPLSAKDLVHEFEALGSPIGAFLEEWCQLGPEYVAPQGLVFNAWRQWCHDNERQYVGTKASFARDLYAAMPGLGKKRIGPRGEQVKHWVGLRLAEEQLEMLEDSGAEL